MESGQTLRLNGSQERAQSVCSYHRTLFFASSHLMLRRRDAFLAAQAHVCLALTGAALPWKKTEQRQDGALNDAFPRQATILLVTAGGTRPHENLNGLMAGRASRSEGRIT